MYTQNVSNSGTMNSFSDLNMEVESKPLLTIFKSEPDMTMTETPKFENKPTEATGRITTNRPKCDVCQKYFSHLGYLSTHMRIHSGEKPYQCTVCPKAFTQSCTLKTHLKIHTGEKPYSCVVCNKPFSDSSNFRKHMRIHTGEKLYQCAVCQKSFGTSSQLNYHRKAHNNENPPQQ